MLVARRATASVKAISVGVDCGAVPDFAFSFLLSSPGYGERGREIFGSGVDISISLSGILPSPPKSESTSIISLMTLDEKIACLGTDPSVPRLGIKGSHHVEGIHGLAQGGPANWRPKRIVPTTIFPQGIGMAETWDVDMLRQAGEIEGFEARYIFQSPRYGQGGIVIRSPNADMGRDPRWGRT
jgi:hypothetical protein